MDDKYADWFLELVKSIYDHRDCGRQVVFTEEDDKMAREVHRRLRGLEDER